MRNIHIAIMRKSWGLTEKILSGEKTIESRWLKNRSCPWGKIKAGETVYFKNSGEPVSIKARVKAVRQFENLTPAKAKGILDEFGQAGGLGIKPEEKEKYFEMFKEKKYCLLVFLEKPEAVTPFEIDKTGFGMMAAWLTVENLDRIKKNR